MGHHDELPGHRACSKNTNLAVVAPGIAEALFATALGLLAAIPAVIFYNKFNSDAARQGARLEGFADEFSAILSRQIDETALRSDDGSASAARCGRGERGDAGAARRPADERDQRHADGRRDARAAHHLHGDGAAAHRRRADRAAEVGSEAARGDKEPLTITVDPDGKIFLQETELQIDEIVPKLTAIAKAGFDERIFVRGDRRVNYGVVMRVMGTISAAGFRRIASSPISKRSRNKGHMVRKSAVISIALHLAILLWVVVAFPTGRALDAPMIEDVPDRHRLAVRVHQDQGGHGRRQGRGAARAEARGAEARSRDREGAAEAAEG